MGPVPERTVPAGASHLRAADRKPRGPSMDTAITVLAGTDAGATGGLARGGRLRRPVPPLPLHLLLSVGAASREGRQRGHGVAGGLGLFGSGALGAKEGRALSESHRAEVGRRGPRGGKGVDGVG